MNAEQSSFLTLAIETSCDDTAAAVLRGRTLMASVVASQLLDQRFGGVVPELASRQHVRWILPVIRQVIGDAGIHLSELDQIAVTYGPGLVGSLLVGINTAQAMAYALHKPLIPVNHIEAHMLAVFLEHEPIEWPLLALIVSGGHTLLVEAEAPGVYCLLGETRDDAAGECFDKTARMLGLLQSEGQTMGGPLIEAQAAGGNPAAFDFPRPMIQSGDGHFSFSGLKTAMALFVQSHPPEFIHERMEDICASFQEAVVEVLAEKTLHALRHSSARSLIVAGGVAANRRLIEKIRQGAAEFNRPVYVPSKKFCTDNAAMIGITAVIRAGNPKPFHWNITPCPNLQITESTPMDNP